MQKQFICHLPSAIAKEVEEGRAAVMGGAVRCEFDGTPLSDVDVYVFSRENFTRLVREVGAVEVSEVAGLYQISGEVPIELTFDPACTTPKECVAHADFDIASGIYCEGCLYSAPSFSDAVQNKIMRFLGTKDPQHSYARYIKYNRKYGYCIDSSVNELLRIWSEQTK